MTSGLLVESMVSQASSQEVSVRTLSCWEMASVGVGRSHKPGCGLRLTYPKREEQVNERQAGLMSFVVENTLWIISIHTKPLFCGDHPGRGRCVKTFGTLARVDIYLSDPLYSP